VGKRTEEKTKSAGTGLKGTGKTGDLVCAGEENNPRKGERPSRKKAFTRGGGEAQEGLRPFRKKNLESERIRLKLRLTGPALTFKKKEKV